MAPTTWKSQLGALFAPKSIAIVGASDRHHIARGTFEGMRTIGYAGRVIPVNPGRDTVYELPAYPSLRAIPERPDLAIIIVNAQATVEALQEAADLGIPAAVLMATGFGESGEEGAALSRRLEEIAAEHQLRICGPGSFGLISVRDRVSAYMNPVRGTLEPGPVAVVTQSGSLVNLIIALGQERHLGYSYLVSAGSEASLSVTDYLSYFVEDPETRVLAAVVEQFRDPAGLIRLAERAAELAKPLVVLKLGRSEAAQRASQAHTGALVGSAEVHDAVFRHYGVVSVGNLDELIEAATVLAKAKRPAGKRVAVVSVSGGDCVLGTEMSARAGVELAELTPQTQTALRELMPEAGMVANPIDAGMRPIWQQGLFAQLIELVVGDPNVDAVAARLNIALPLLRDLGPVAGAASKPILTFTRATQALNPDFYAASEETGVPILQEVEKSFRAIRHLLDYAGFCRRPAQAPRLTSPAPLSSNRAVLTEFESKRVLAEYGISVTRERLVNSPSEAATAAAELGYPVALKVMSPDILHKTEAGVLRLSLQSEAELLAAYVDLEVAAGKVPAARIDGMLVQEMAAAAGTEVIAGMFRDPQFGPVLVFGLGGVFVEVLRDSAFRLPRIDAEQALEMIAETKAGQVLKGIRGRPPANLPALAGLLARFSEFCADHGEALEAVDLNPIFAWEGGAKVLDASILFRPG